MSLGDEPLSTKILFGSPYQRPKVAFASDEDGKFTGYLPHEGTWPVTLVADDDVSIFNVSPVEVFRRSGKTYAEVEIELSDTRIAGRVEKKGESVDGALVKVFRQDRKRQYESDLKADEDGMFELRGLEPTAVALSARFGTARSEWAYVDVLEGDPGPEIVFELKERMKLSG